MFENKRKQLDIAEDAALWKIHTAEDRLRQLEASRRNNLRSGGNPLWRRFLDWQIRRQRRKLDKAREERERVLLARHMLLESL